MNAITYALAALSALMVWGVVREYRTATAYSRHTTSATAVLAQTVPAQPHRKGHMSIRKSLTALMACLGLLLTALVGVQAAQPAQAITGTSVLYSSCSGSGCSHPLRIVRTSGVADTLRLRDKAGNVFQIKPWSFSQRIKVVAPSGQTRTMACGQSFTPAGTGIYKVRQMSC